jgi:outer membrane lipoprotein-sorting protein
MTKRQLPAAVLAAALLMPASATPIGGAAPGKLTTGRAVMEEFDRRRRTDGEYSEGTVTVEEKGTVRRKAWRSWRIGWGAEVKGLVQFLEPAEVKGVSLLTVTHSDKADEQWFYAPAVDRDRRIARQEKTTRFLGTHFTYEDFEEQVLDDYDYELKPDEDLDGTACYVVEAKPRPRKESQYSKLVLRLSRDQLVTLKSDAYIDGELRRTFVSSNVKTIEGIPTAQRIVVSDTKREGRTVLELANVRYRVKLDPSTFTLQSLRDLQPPPAEIPGR